MPVALTILAGPHEGQQFVFDQHDTFLVGRSPDAHLQLPRDDPYCSRHHFLIEVHPPRCRLIDLGSHNGTFVNGARVQSAELRDTDEIRAGHTRIRVQTSQPGSEYPTLATVEGITANISPPFAPLPGYTIHRELGRGGMGIVYRATCLADGNTVAIKTITPAASAARKHIELFMREASVLRELDHPHIVRFRDHGEHDGVLYLVMEFVNGTNAAQILRQDGPLPIRTAVRMIYQVLKGLGHAHEKEIVHRDIKPANILIEETPPRRMAKLADFGLARAIAGSQLSGVTLQGEVSGTFGYMAPEQITHFRMVKPVADLYSVAATLYHLLTGFLPHDLPISPVEQIAYVLGHDPVPIRERRSDIPNELSEGIMRTLSAEAGNRFPNAEAFRQALRPFGQL